MGAEGMGGDERLDGSPVGGVDQGDTSSEVVIPKKIGVTGQQLVRALVGLTGAEVGFSPRELRGDLPDVPLRPEEKEALDKN